MTVKQLLTELKKEIKSNCPKLPKNQHATTENDKIKLSITNDIQNRFAEIYGLIECVTLNDELNLNYSAAFNKFPDCMNSLIQSIPIIALAIKTKLNLAQDKNIFTTTEIERINDTCLKCYVIQSILSNPDFNPDTKPNMKNEFQKGIVKQHRYKAYPWNVERVISPIATSRISSFSIGEPKKVAIYADMINESRKKLDLTCSSKIEITPITPSSSHLTYELKSHLATLNQDRENKNTKPNQSDFSGLKRGFFNTPRKNITTTKQDSDNNKNKEPNYAGLKKGFFE